MKKVVPVVFLVFVAAMAIAADKAIPELIRDLGVQDKGNYTCNTACGILVMKKDKVVPHLEKALGNSNKRVRYYAVRCLGSINTEKSRASLIRAFSKGKSDVREHAAYALTWYPHQDAEKVYVTFLAGQDRWHVRHGIKALGEIRSQKALPHLIAICDNPEGWHFYYTAVVAIRKIESKELLQQVLDALDFLRKAKYSTTVDKKRLSEATEVIKANIQATLPDVFDIALWVTKGNESRIEPNSKTILRDAGTMAYPYFKIGMKDSDENIRRRTDGLMRELSLDYSTIKEDL